MASTKTSEKARPKEEAVTSETAIHLGSIPMSAGHVPVRVS